MNLFYTLHSIGINEITEKIIFIKSFNASASNKISVTFVSQSGHVLKQKESLRADLGVLLIFCVYSRPWRFSDGALTNPSAIILFRNSVRLLTFLSGGGLRSWS